MTYDLIIVGAGTAGMPCALEAAKRGRTVLVVEKDSKVGGTLHLTGGHMSAGGTRQQTQKGITDTVQAHFDDVMDISFGTADPGLVRVATQEAPQTIAWLDSLGFDFAPESPRLVYGHVPYKTARTHHGTEAGKSILKVLMPLWEQTLATGNGPAARLTCLLEHTLTELLTEGNRVVGVKCLHEGKERLFYGQNVVLTTGGYGGNPAFFGQRHPEFPPLKSAANPLCRGEGITVAEQSGAATWGFEKHIGSLGGVELEPDSGIVDFWSAWAMVLTSIYRTTREIYVNMAGQRFMNEDEINADTRERLVAAQPGQCFFILFEEAALNAPGLTIMLNWSADRIRAEAEKGKVIVKADSLAELAQKTGLPLAELTQTVFRFNGFVAEGSDDDFGRTSLENGLLQPPFYAIKSHVSVLLTFGGIRVNEQLQVLNTDGQVIDNLYAAGETIGMAATSGNAFCSGMAVTPALSFGRILGRNL
jgi:flavocytochrome c